MSTKTKSALADVTPALPASTPDPIKAQVDLKQKQLRRGKTEGEVKRVKAKLEAKRAALAQSEQMDTDEDSTVAIQRIKQAEQAVSDTEKELALVMKKDEAAQISLRQAEQAEQIEAEVEVTARVARGFLKAERLIAQLRSLSEEELGPDLDAARDVFAKSRAREGEWNFIQKLPSVLKQHLGLAVHVLLKEGYVPPNLRAYKKLTDCIPDELYIRSRPRPEPSPATPIKGWQIGG